jgi:DNA invertase Pin-like site-specific DNA recombinase
MNDAQPPRIVGYARVSTGEQNECGQVEALRRVGATEIVVEKVSGIGARPELDALVAKLVGGESLVVTEVSRLGRTTTSVLLLAEQLENRGIHLRILNLGIDTATPTGGLVLTMMAGLAKFERELLRERQARGIDAARRAGKHLGRPTLLGAGHAQIAIERMRGGETLGMIATEWQVSERTVSRLLRRHADSVAPTRLSSGKKISKTPQTCRDNREMAT